MKFSLFSIICIIFSSFNRCGNNNVSTFEGVITYKLSVEIKVKDEYSDYLSKKYGKEMKFFWNQNGDLSRETYGNENGLQYHIYNKKENTCYTKFRGFDTLYYYPASENLNEIIKIEKGPDEVILDQKCKSFVYTVSGDFDNKEFTMTYYYSGKPYINSGLYEELKDGFANDVYARTKSPFMKMVLDFNNYKVTYVATSIQEEKVDDEKFMIDNSLPKKYF